MQGLIQGNLGSPQGNALHAQPGQSFKVGFCLPDVAGRDGQVHGGVQVLRHDHHQCLPGGRVIRIENEQQVVQTGLKQRMQVSLIGQFQSIREQPGDLADLLGVGDQGREVLPQGRLAAGEGDMRNADCPGLIQDGLPFPGGQFAVNPFCRGILSLGPGGQAIGQRAVKAQGCGQVLGMRGHAFKVKVGSRVEIRGVDHGLDAVTEIHVILQRLCPADVIAFGHLSGGFLGWRPFHHVVGKFSTGGVEMQDGGRVDDQDAGTIL